MNDCVKKYLITTPMLICLAFSGACRSTDKESFKTAQLNQYDQIDTLSRGDPDSRGIITYDTFQILIASGSETIADIAKRLDIDGNKLALYNGLIPNYRPRAQEMIALPEDRFISSSGWSTEITSSKIEESPDQEPKISAASNPLRHRIKEGETVYSLAREYKVSVNSIATWNGLGPDLDIKTGREIIIPAAVSTFKKENKAKKTLSKTAETPDANTEESNKNSTDSLNANLTDEESNTVDKKPKELPEAKIISVKPFIAPVDGVIISKYSQDKGSQNNNGVDYDTPVGTTVKAVSDGTVVLISDIVGGKGKIVLVRHDNQLITIYGRLTNITVIKGQTLLQGQTIGDVIGDPETNKGLMHFEVRKGMKSIDPETMIR